MKFVYLCLHHCKCLALYLVQYYGYNLAQKLITYQMNKIRIWLDCDPGHDDMLAIIMAALSERIELIGISTSAGNSVIENTTQNALNILYEIGRPEIEVVQGAEGPLCRKLNTAAEMHGKSGLQGAVLLKSPNSPVTEKPFLHIYNKIMDQTEQIHFVVTGAMTNLAIILKAFPDIKHKIKTVTIMGGAIGLGNWSPAAQFNILVDPQAAQIVFSSALPVTMVPLEVTHTNLVTEDIFTKLQALQSDFGKKLPPLFRYFQKTYKELQDFDFPVAHDPSLKILVEKRFSIDLKIRNVKRPYKLLLYAQAGKCFNLHEDERVVILVDNDGLSTKNKMIAKSII